MERKAYETMSIYLNFLYLTIWQNFPPQLKPDINALKNSIDIGFISQGDDDNPFLYDYNIAKGRLIIDPCLFALPQRDTIRTLAAALASFLLSEGIVDENECSQTIRSEIEKIRNASNDKDHLEIGFFGHTYYCLTKEGEVYDLTPQSSNINLIFTTLFAIITDQIFKRNGDIARFEEDIKNRRIKPDEDTETHPSLLRIFINIAQNMPWQEILSALQGPTVATYHLIEQYFGYWSTNIIDALEEAFYTDVIRWQNFDLPKSINEN